MRVKITKVFWNFELFLDEKVTYTVNLCNSLLIL